MGCGAAEQAAAARPQGVEARWKGGGLMRRDVHRHEGVAGRCRSPWVTGPALLMVVVGPDGVPRTRAVYGAISGRWWVGEVGQSALVATTVHLDAPVCERERKTALASGHEYMVARLTQLAHERYGLDAQEAIKERVQLQVEWQAKEDARVGRLPLSERVGQFEYGYTTKQHGGTTRMRVGDGDIKRIAERFRALTGAPEQGIRPNESGRSGAVHAGADTGAEHGAAAADRAAVPIVPADDQLRRDDEVRVAGGPADG